MAKVKSLICLLFPLVLYGNGEAEGAAAVHDDGRAYGPPSPADTTVSRPGAFHIEPERNGRGLSEKEYPVNEYRPLDDAARTVEAENGFVYGHRLLAEYADERYGGVFSGTPERACRPATAESVPEERPMPGTEGRDTLGSRRATAAADSILTRKGLSLVRQMRRLAAAKEYVAHAVGPAYAARIEGAGLPDSGDPAGIFAVHDLDKAALAMPCWAPFLAGLPDEVTEMATGKLLSHIPAMLAGKEEDGAMNAALSSVLAAGSAFVCPGLDSPSLYLYLYENGWHGMVLFVPAEDDVVKADACFVLNPRLNEVRTAGEVGRFLEETLVMEGIRAERMPCPASAGKNDGGFGR